MSRTSSPYPNPEVARYAMKDLVLCVGKITEGFCFVVDCSVLYNFGIRICLPFYSLSAAKCLPFKTNFFVEKVIDEFDAQMHPI